MFVANTRDFGVQHTRVCIRNTHPLSSCHKWCKVVSCLAILFQYCSRMIAVDRILLASWHIAVQLVKPLLLAGACWLIGLFLTSIHLIGT